MTCIFKYFAWLFTHAARHYLIHAHSNVDTSLYRIINSESTQMGFLIDSGYMYGGSWRALKRRHWHCLYNSLKAASVVLVVSCAWRACLFCASGLCSFWQTMRALCQSLPGNHNYNKHQTFSFPPHPPLFYYYFSFQLKAQFWSQADPRPAHFLSGVSKASPNKQELLHIWQLPRAPA